jgi:hypothetical protein
MERRLNKTLVRITDEELSGHACTRVETIHPDRIAGSFYGYRCVLWLDKATHLPLGAETYDWPRQGGAEGYDSWSRIASWMFAAISDSTMIPFVADSA